MAPPVPLIMILPSKHQTDPAYDCDQQRRIRQIADTHDQPGNGAQCKNHIVGLPASLIKTASGKLPDLFLCQKPPVSMTIWQNCQLWGTAMAHWGTIAPHEYQYLQTDHHRLCHHRFQQLHGQPWTRTGWTAKKEFELLFKLLFYPNMIFTKSQLLEDILGLETDSDDSTIKTHINRFHNKFGNWDEFQIITIRGLGYKLELQGKA